MKILCNYTPCGPSFVRSGWAKVFQALGHKFAFWQPEAKPAFDIFSEFEPDLFIGTTYGVNRSVYKNIVARPNMKVILYCSAWGSLIDQMNLKDYPIVVVNDNEKALIEKLKKETGQPEFVFCHYHDNWVERTLGGWQSIGVKPVGILNAADTFDYLNGTYKPEFDSDLSFVGGYWPYKSRNLDKLFLPLCQSREFKIKIFGNQPWSVPQYLGYVDTADVKDIFVSARICPNISEPHSTDWGFDVIERPYKVLSAGGFCISDYVQSGVEDIFGNTIPVAKTTQEFNSLLAHYLDRPEERKELADKGKELVLKSHTYFDRVAKMFYHLGLEDEAKKTEELKKKFLQS